MQAAWIMLGGSVGALLRYGVSRACVRWFGAGFPAGTLAVNLAGCFLIGLALGLAERSAVFGPSFRLFFVTGFLGALTTFSTFAWETTAAMQSGAVGLAVVNILVNNLGGLGLVVFGLWLARG